MDPEEVLKKFGTKLLALPVRDPNFIALLNEENLLPGDTEEKMRQGTTKQGAQYFLGTIKTSLSVSRTNYDKLLIVMKKSKDSTIKELADQMEKCPGI